MDARLTTGEKISQALQGHKVSKKTREKISKALKGRKGHVAWNSGKTGCNCGPKKGNIPWNKGQVLGYDSPLKGKKLSKEHRKKLSDAKKGICSNVAGKHWKMNDKDRKKLSQRIRGKNNHFWRGGKSFEPYGLKFNNELKKQVRERDNYICQECGKKQKKPKLDIHHIDYDKTKNDPINLISLCRNCHLKTNFKREDWTKYFREKTI